MEFHSYIFNSAVYISKRRLNHIQLFLHKLDANTPYPVEGEIYEFNISERLFNEYIKGIDVGYIPKLSIQEY